MSQPDIHDEWWPPPGENDPPEDLSREEAAYARELHRLVPEHLGRIALIYKDAVVGIFDTAGEGFRDGFRRFGLVRMVLKPIRDPTEPRDFISLVDVNHPSFRRVDQEPAEAHGQVHGESA